MKVLLIDNGSLVPASTQALREVAAELAMRTGCKIAPVSLQHSDRVSAEQLDGEAAEVLSTWLRREVVGGETDFVVLPFFLGPSRAILEYLPAVAAGVREEWPGLRLRVAAPLYQPGDDRLAQILSVLVRDELTPSFLRGERARVALVDHGSPLVAVTAVRDALAVQLSGTLGATVAAVAPCSMERRPGADYAFNEPLLADLLARERWSAGPVIVAQLFLGPGRHAGPDGDIARICADALKAAPNLRIVRTAPLGSHPMLLDVLTDRLQQVLRPR